MKNLLNRSVEWLLNLYESLMIKAVLVLIPLTIITLIWAVSIHALSGVFYNNLSAPFLK